MLLCGEESWHHYEKSQYSGFLAFVEAIHHHLGPSLQGMSLKIDIVMGCLVLRDPVITNGERREQPINLDMSHLYELPLLGASWQVGRAHLIHHYCPKQISFELRHLFDFETSDLENTIESWESESFLTSHKARIPQSAPE